MGEAHGAFGGAEHGFNGLLAFLVEGVFFQPGLHGLAPWFGGLPDWLGIGRQAEVIGPLPPGAPECHQRLDPACLQGRHGRAAGNAGVDQNCAGQADSRLHAQHGLSEARRVGRGCDQVGGQDQLRPLGGHYGLGAEGLPVFVRVRAARRSGASERCLGRSGCFADPAAVCRPAAGVGGRAVLAAYAAAASATSAAVSVASFAQHPRPVAAQGAELGRVRVHLGAVDRRRAQPQQPGFARQQQHMQECRPAEARGVCG